MHVGTLLLAYFLHRPSRTLAAQPPFAGQIQAKANLYKCLDLYGGNTTNGTPIDVWDCTGVDSQNWAYDSTTSQIRSMKDPTKCIDLRGGSTQKGNTLEIW